MPPPFLLINKLIIHIINNRLLSALGLLAGGNANNGWNVGPFYGNWNNDAGNSNWNYAGLPIPHIYTFVSGH